MKNKGFGLVGVLIAIGVIVVFGAGYYLTQEKDLTFEESDDFEVIVDTTENVDNTEEDELEVVDDPIEQVNSEDGEYISYIKRVYKDEGKWFIDFDYAQYLTGQEAKDKAVETGKCQSDYSNCFPNGVWLYVNENPKIRTFEVSGGALIKMVNNCIAVYDWGLDPAGFVKDEKETRIYEWITSIENLKKISENMDVLPYTIVINSNKVISIKENYLP